MEQGANAMAAVLSGRALFVFVASCRSAGNRPPPQRLGPEEEALQVQQNAVAASRLAKIEVGRQYWRVDFD
jgi:hypothetical protein